MKAKAKIERIVFLELTEKEAYWLKSLVQNPIHGTLSTENEEDKKIREIFFNALHTVTKPI